MAWKEKKTVDSNIELPTGYPAFSRISSFVKQLINASQYDYHESEAFEVDEVILNAPSTLAIGGALKNRGCVKGTFINNPNQPILGDVVKPLMPNILQVPLVGEHVVVIEYNGQHYYTSIINRKGSVNENSIPGAAGNYKKNTKFGEKFERKDVKPLEISEGCILFEGRFGQSIHFGSELTHKTETVTDGDGNEEEVKIAVQKPIIKIVAGHRGTTENINKDDSSIHLFGAEDNSDIESKKIKIKSNDIFITGKRNLFLEADSVFINAKKQNTIKMGDPRAPMIPTVRGDVMLKFQSDILTLLSDFQQVLILIANPVAFAAKAKLLLDKILRLTEVITKQTFLNKQVVTADPNFKLPEIPEGPDLNLPEFTDKLKVKTGLSIEDIPNNT